MNYRSVTDLNQTIINGLSGLPPQIDLVVGVPRSGMLAANLVALHLNLPVIDVEGFIEGRQVGFGIRGARRGISPATCHARKVLVLDDSVLSGETMRTVKQRLHRRPQNVDLLFGAVYAAPEGSSEVDFSFEEVLLPRTFEWNLMHGGAIANACVDIDGVLCVDPTERENDDGPRYQRFLQEAAPRLLPTAPVGWLVTCRLEKYRDLTEQWLQRYGVRYRQLDMMDLPSKAARLASASHGSFKAQIYRDTNASLFVESSSRQAMEIARLSGKPVLCVETNQMVYPPLMAHLPQFTARLPRRSRAALRRLKRGFQRRVLGFDPARAARTC